MAEQADEQQQEEAEAKMDVVMADAEVGNGQKHALREKEVIDSMKSFWVYCQPSELYTLLATRQQAEPLFLRRTLGYIHRSSSRRVPRPRTSRCNRLSIEVANLTGGDWTLSTFVFVCRKVQHGEYVPLCATMLFIPPFVTDPRLPHPYPKATFYPPSATGAAGGFAGAPGSDLVLLLVVWEEHPDLQCKKRQGMPLDIGLRQDLIAGWLPPGAAVRWGELKVWEPLRSYNHTFKVTLKEGTMDRQLDVGMRPGSSSRAAVAPAAAATAAVTARQKDAGSSSCAAAARGRAAGAAAAAAAAAAAVAADDKAVDIIRFGPPRRRADEGAKAVAPNGIAAAAAGPSSAAAAMAAARGGGRLVSHQRLQGGIEMQVILRHEAGCTMHASGRFRRDDFPAALDPFGGGGPAGPSARGGAGGAAVAANGAAGGGGDGGKVYWRFFYDNDRSYIQEKSVNFACPLCHMRCTSRQGLIEHTKRSHDLFEWTWGEAHPHVAPVCNVRVGPGLYDEDGCFRSREAERYQMQPEQKDFYHHSRQTTEPVDWGIEGQPAATAAPSGLPRPGTNVPGHPRLHPRTLGPGGPRRLPGVAALHRMDSETGAPANSAASSDLDALYGVGGGGGPPGVAAQHWARARSRGSGQLQHQQALLQQQQQHAAAGMVRVLCDGLEGRYFHSATAVPMTIKEVVGDYDSDDEEDFEEWKKRGRRNMDQSRDLTLEEREFMLMWNEHTHVRPVFSDAHTATVCESFARSNAERLRTRSALRHCFTVHLLNLWEYQLLDTASLHRCLALVPPVLPGA